MKKINRAKIIFMMIIVSITVLGIFYSSCYSKILEDQPGLVATSRNFMGFNIFPSIIFGSVTRKNILENQIRFEIYKLIDENPGIYFSEILRDGDLKKGTLEYHLKIMESEGTVCSVCESGKHHYFIGDSSYSNEEKELFLIMRDGTLKRIITEVYKNPRINNKKIAENTGYSESTTSKHLGFLKGKGVIESQTKGWFTMYNISDDFYNLFEKHIYSEFRVK
ncbi:conserved hypothetical protein [Methanolacinia petrolearia DSM 11571]|uniref:HTH arsR-type domain-containing protein n=1 Tax=Methanolacinia petrolearia (strain DSM 11571 / OCM 486 / SEBR 4847) TaxID=679926 RepID=E1RGR0_METP4|nr:winged helix-turn-helix transcriptional regulator [Methanolacinia petrolearia]ADN36355.1 conserved hypothetical protein [Methanolacinia petrolearia DSM 11571]